MRVERAAAAVPDHRSAVPRLTTSNVRNLSLASLGGAFEYYEFVIFVFLTPIIAKLFFPPDLPEWIRQAQTFAIFAAGYLARPLGGIVMAHFGDTSGRKKMFTVSVLLMAIPTLTIGLLPTYASAGKIAPLLLLLMRLTQGAAVGGEVPGAWVFVGEHASRGKTGLAIGLLTSAFCVGILFGSLTAIALDLAFSPGQIAQGAWRIPFLLGGLLGFGAVMPRRSLSETAVFEELRQREALSREPPLRLVMRDHRKAVLASILSTCMLTSGIVVILLMSPTLLQKSFGLTARDAQWANLAGTAALGPCIILIGIATDRFGLPRVAVPALLLLIGGSYALYFGTQWRPGLLLPFYVLAGVGVGAAVQAPLLMFRAFPPAVRFSGVSFSYNIAYAIFGGLTPPLVSWLSHLNPIGPAHYVAVSAVGGAMALLLIPATASISLETTVSK
jgi:MFS family permease